MSAGDAGRRRDRASDWSLGLVLIVAALGAAWLSVGYGVGGVAEMGPGFLPLTIAIVLAALGCLIVLGRTGDAADDESHSTEASALGANGMALRTGRVLVGVLGSVALFGLTVQPLGVALSTLIVVVVAAAARKGARPVETAILAVGLAAFCSVVFVTLLGLRLSMFPA